MLHAPCRHPLGCLLGCFCPPCFACYLRNEALQGDMTKYGALTLAPSKFMGMAERYFSVLRFACFIFVEPHTKERAHTRTSPYPAVCVTAVHGLQCLLDAQHARAGSCSCVNTSTQRGECQHEGTSAASAIFARRAQKTARAAKSRARGHASALKRGSAGASPSRPRASTFRRSVRVRRSDAHYDRARHAYLLRSPFMTWHVALLLCQCNSPAHKTLVRTLVDHVYSLLVTLMASAALACCASLCVVRNSPVCIALAVCHVESCRCLTSSTSPRTIAADTRASRRPTRSYDRRVRQPYHPV